MGSLRRSGSCLLLLSLMGGSAGNKGTPYIGITYCSLSPYSPPVSKGHGELKIRTVVVRDSSVGICCLRGPGEVKIRMILEMITKVHGGTAEAKVIWPFKGSGFSLSRVQDFRRLQVCSVRGSGLPSRSLKRFQLCRGC